jgi:uncharacterized damage-inducible protein DinB
MSDVDEQGRPEPPIDGDELSILRGFLDFHRATFAWKTNISDADALNRTVGSSTMTLGGMIKHLALVEEHWFSYVLHNRELEAPWDTVDWDADPDWDWHSAVDDSPDDLRELWRNAVARSEASLENALADGGLDRPSPRRRRSDGRATSLRWIVVHMIEEYCRHNGHADLIRESIDGLTGE